MHVCGCCWLIACSASVCPRRCFRLRLSHAYANLDCWVALLLSYFYFFFLLSLSFDFFFFFFFFFFSSPLCVCQECACAKSLIVSRARRDAPGAKCTITPDVRKTASGCRRWRLLQRLNVLLDCLLRVLLFALYWPLGPTVIHRSLLLSRFRSRNR